MIGPGSDKYANVGSFGCKISFPHLYLSPSISVRDFFLQLPRPLTSSPSSWVKSRFCFAPDVSGQVQASFQKVKYKLFQPPSWGRKSFLFLFFFSVWFFILIFHNIAIHHPFRTNVYKVCTTNPNIGPAMLLPITKLFHHFSRCANGTGWGWNGSIIVRSRR